MNLESHALVLSVIEEFERSRYEIGRTHLQKSVFLFKLLNANIPFEFFLFRHGPFSFSLADSLAQMEAYGAVEIQPRSGVGVLIVPGDNTHLLKSQCSVDFGVLKDLRRVVEFVDSRAVRSLEALATLGWILSMEGVRLKDIALARLQTLKPHISTDAGGIAYEEIYDFLNFR